MREGTSSQNLMKIEAKEMAMMPTARPAKVFTNGFPLPYTGGSIGEVPWGVKRKVQLKPIAVDRAGNKTS